MPLAKLRQLRSELDALIGELESGSQREIDIAADHSGDPASIQEVLEIQGVQEKGRWRQLQRVYCSAQRCEGCPHGPYWYRYSRTKRKGSVAVKYDGKPFFDYETIQFYRQMVREPEVVYAIPTISEGNSDR